MKTVTLDELDTFDPETGDINVGSKHPGAAVISMPMMPGMIFSNSRKYCLQERSSPTTLALFLLP